MLHSLADSARNHRVAFRNFLCAVSIAALSGFAASQVTPQHGRGDAISPHAPASNAQLASPDIERRVDDLLKQMTLEEKIGQLVQYNDIGYAAATMTTISFLPQLIRVVKLKSARDISLGMFLIFSAGTFGWLVYGLLSHSAPVWIANAVTLVLSVSILLLKLKYDERATEPVQPGGAPR